MLVCALDLTVEHARRMSKHRTDDVIYTSKEMSVSLQYSSVQACYIVHVYVELRWKTHSIGDGVLCSGKVDVLE